MHDGEMPYLPKPSEVQENKSIRAVISLLTVFCQTGISDIFRFLASFSYSYEIQNHYLCLTIFTWCKFFRSSLILMKPTNLSPRKSLSWFLTCVFNFQQSCVLRRQMHFIKVFPEWSRAFIEISDFSEFGESDKSLKHITSFCGHLTCIETLWNLWSEARIDPMEMFCFRHTFFLWPYMDLLR